MISIAWSVPFIGRAAELQRIQSLVSKHGTTNLILLQGRGGIGKTRLLHEIQSRCPTWADNVRIVFLDLQNIASRSEEFLVSALANQLGVSYFQRSQQIALPRSTHDSGMSQVPDTLAYEDLGPILVQELNEFTAVFRLVFIIDTFELMGRTRLAKFLFDNLPACQDTLFIFAGREISQEDLNRIEASSVDSVEVIELAGFTADETNLLFEELIGSRYSNSDIPKKVHVLSGGRPILVLLAIDWLKRSMNLPKLGNRSLKSISVEELEEAVHPEAMPQQLDMLRDLRKEFESKLVSQVQKLDKPDEMAILCMALAYLRCNAQILSVLMIEALGGKNDPEHTYDPKRTKELIGTLSTTSFVKVWSMEPDLACALHDEMRRLVLEYVWQNVDATYEQRSKLIQHLIHKYYDKEIDKLQNEKKELTLDKSLDLKTEEFHTLTAQIDLLKVERLRYLLEYDPQVGSNQFVELYEEAMRSRNSLRCEFLLDEMDRAGFGKDVEPYRARLLVRSSQDADITAAEKILSQKTASTEDRITILQTLALKNPPRDRLRLYQQALELARNLNDSRLLGKILNNLGLTHRICGEWDQAIERYQRALEQCRLANDEVQLAATLNNLAYVLMLKGDYNQADRLCRLALALRERLPVENERDLAFSYLTTGALYREQGDLHQAFIRFRQARAVFARLADVDGQLQAYMELADMGGRLGNYAKAEEWISIIRALRKQVSKNKSLEAEASLIVGRVRRMQFSASSQFQLEITEANKLGDLARMALESFKQALALASEIGDDYLSARANYELAYLAYLGGPVKDANIYIEEALAKVKGRFTRLEGYLEELQGHQEFKAQQYETAAAHYANACNRMASFNRRQYQTTYDRVAQRLLSLLPGSEDPPEHASAFRAFCQGMLNVLLPDRVALAPLIQLIQFSLEVADRKVALPQLWVGVPATSPPARSVFAGREEQLRELERALSEAKTGQTRVIFIGGEAGFGKTYLIEFFLNGLQGMVGEFPVAIHRSRFGSSTRQSMLAPYRTLVYDLIDNYLSLTRDVNSIEDRVAQFWQFLNNFAPNWVGILSTTRRAPDSTISEWPRIPDEDVQRRAIFSQFVEIVRQVTQFQPVVMWIDDMHLADSYSLELLEYLAVHEAKDLPFLVICTYQTSKVTPHLEKVMQAVEKSPASKILTDLRELDVESYIRKRYPDLSFPHDYDVVQFVKFVEESTRGLPLHLAQLFDWWEEIGAIIQQGQTWRLIRRVDQISYIPTEIATILHSRLERVEKDNLMPLLEVTAILGEPFLAQVAECMLKEESWRTEAVHNGLTRLSENYRLIIRDDILTQTSENIYRFAYPLVHIEIYERLRKRMKPEQLQALHARAGRCLENELNRITAEAYIDIHTGWITDAKMQLIRHFREAGLHEKALSALLAEARLREFYEAKDYYRQAAQEATYLYPSILPGLEHAIANFNKAVSSEDRLLHFNMIGDWLSMLLIGTDLNVPQALVKSVGSSVRAALTGSDDEAAIGIMQRINALLLILTPLVIGGSLTKEQPIQHFELMRLLGDWCVAYYQSTESLQGEADYWAYLTWVANKAQFDYTEFAQTTADQYSKLGEQLKTAGDLDGVLYCWDRAAWHYRAIEQYSTSADLYHQLADLVESTETRSHLRLGFLASAVAVSWRDFIHRKELSQTLGDEKALDMALLIKRVADEMAHELTASQIAGLLYDRSLELLSPGESELINTINSGKRESDHRLKHARDRASKGRAAVVGLAIGEDVVSDRVASFLIEEGIDARFTWPIKKDEFRALENSSDLIVLVGGPRSPSPVGQFVLDVFIGEPRLYELYDTQRSRSHIWYRRVNSVTYLLIAGSNFIATMNAVNEFVTSEQWQEWLQGVSRSP